MIMLWILKNLFCKHKSKIELYRCYQDRYISECCTNCRKVIYNDI